MERLSFRERIQAGERVWGSFVLCGDPSIVRVADSAGLHVLVLDYEHGMLSKELTSRFIDAAKFSGISVFVRCKMEELYQLGSILDHGLEGVIVAGARSIEDVQLVLDTVKFNPDGDRGINPFVPAAGYGKISGSDFAHISNKQTNVWVMAENRQLFSQLEEICALQHLDGVFLGPYDLSFDLGHPGEVTHPAITGALDQALQIVQSRGLSAGIFASNDKNARAWIQKGVQFIVVGVDLATLMNAWNDTVHTLNSLSAGQ